MKLDPHGDRHLAQLVWGLRRQGVECSTLSEAKARADAIEASHLRQMKLHTALFVGLPALALVFLLPGSMSSAFGYVAWVASLAVAAEMLLRACEAGMWDEWGWLGPGRAYRRATGIDRFIDRHVVGVDDGDDQEDRLVRVLD